MKLNLNINLKITESKKSPIQIEIKTKGIKEYILVRDNLINDKIYLDDKSLLDMKTKHNSKLRKVISKELEELYFDMTKCDNAVKKAIDKQQILFEQQRKDDRIEYDKKIQLLMDEIQEFKNK